MYYDIYLVGVGGQGILTIGEIVAEAALKRDLPANFYPTKGMAQRGGFVKAQLRLGRDNVGPSIAEKGADLVIAMELSESLKALRYLKPDGDFVLYSSVWSPTAVMLGKAPYPTVEEVLAEIEKTGGKIIHVKPEGRPEFEGQPVPENVYVLGAACRYSSLGRFINPDEIRVTLENRWKKGVERNLYTFDAGMSSTL
ncbi:MAG: 2-oxoacid:acceptor oxidoreductase family protein [Firmicutes bacterium]|nr:2-oxoacid:acceptor oxidoreductase family protein [Bacillota bacterium]